MDETERRARNVPAVGVILRLWQRAPEVARGDQELADLVELANVAVALVRSVEREAERAERVLLAREEHRHRHREVLVNAGEGHRLREDVCSLWLRRLERRLAVGDPVSVA